MTVGWNRRNTRGASSSGYEDKHATWGSTGDYGNESDKDKDKDKDSVSRKGKQREAEKE